jgi:hypothetical protein
MKFVRSMRVAALTVLALGCVAFAPLSGAKEPGRPDLSGFWNLARGKITPDPTLMKQIAPNTAVLVDTGAFEYPVGDFGGLKLTPKARDIASKWKPEDDMTLSNACKAPSIVYATQGPFPMEIYQGTEFIIFKHEYFDMVRVVFMDGRKVPDDAPHSKTGYSVGRWEGSTLVIETSRVAAATITNNGLGHSDKVKVVERFKLSPDGKTLLATMEFEDPEMLENRGARFIAWTKEPGEYVYPYECDPSFALEYQNQKK